MSKKIGIMSMQRIANYGSFLQAFALRQLILEQGHKVEFVDYHVEKTIIDVNYKEKNKIFKNFFKILDLILYAAPISQKIKFIKSKNNFSRKYLKLLDINKKNYNPNLDCLVIGSDEVFNCIQSNSNVGYSLELFGKNNNAKKVITYAASFGNTTIEKLNNYSKSKEIGNLLSEIDFISVRDNNSGYIVENLTDKKVEYNLDPVLIYNYMDNDSLIPKIEVREKYLILYAYPGRINNFESEWIKKYAKKKKLKIYSIGGIQNCSDKFISCDPFEVLSYFKNADEVITDTFHGSIFSIINNKKFTTLVRKSHGNSYGNEEKLSDLLQRLDLLERMTFDIKDVENINDLEINYNKVKNILESERLKAREYLLKTIN